MHRVSEFLVVDAELSIGDYVLTNGAIAAAVIIDAVVRLRARRVGRCAFSAVQDSFSEGHQAACWKVPQYTRPA